MFYKSGPAQSMVFKSSLVQSLIHGFYFNLPVSDHVFPVLQTWLFLWFHNFGNETLKG